MITEEQKEASRTNGKLSHGPVTPEGKAISSRNSTKFGFFSRNPLLPGESPEQYQHYRAVMMERLAPVGGLEESLADDVVNDSWRLKRVPTIEAGILAVQLCEEQAELALKKARQLDDPPFMERPCKLADPELRAQFAELSAIHKDAMEQMNDPENALGRTFMRDARASSALGRLMRYESMLRRGIDRNMRELRKLQEERRKEVVEKPQEAKVQNEPEQGTAPVANRTPEYSTTVVVARKIQNEPGKQEERVVRKDPGDVAA